MAGADAGDPGSAACLWNRDGLQKSISEALEVEITPGDFISITGAGGKTSLLFAWGRELRRRGLRTAVTTTTHMADPEGDSRFLVFSEESQMEGLTEERVEDDLKVSGKIPFVSAARPDACDLVRICLERYSFVFCASPDPEKPGKVACPPENVLETMREAADVILAEADGARRLPAKWPAPWEPVILPETTVTVAAAGLTALRRPVREAVYRGEEMLRRIREGNLKREPGITAEAFRKETGTEEADPLLTEDLLAFMLQSEEGGRKNAAGVFRAFLNQADTPEQKESAEKIAGILAQSGIPCAWGQLKKQPDHVCTNRAETAAGEKNLRRHRSRAALILLAAGNSRRFGKNKLLYELEGRPMIAHVLETVKELEVGQMILVTQYPEAADLAHAILSGKSPEATEKDPGDMPGEHREYTNPAAEKPQVEVILNRHPELGLSHSMHLGIKAAGGADAYLFLVCDQPYLTRESLQRILTAWEKEGKGIVSLAACGSPRHPNLFDSGYREELLKVEGDRGGRDVLRRHPEDCLLVEASSPRELEDVDCPDDIRLFKA